MDNNKKLFEGLLKADGIEPAGAAESERIAFGKMLDRQLKSKQSKPGIARPDIWRIIMKNSITKLAVAAMLVVAAVISIMFLNKSATPAYAIEQTIEAIRNVQYMHVVRHGVDGQLEDERWIEIKPDGSQGKYRQDTPHSSFYVVDNLENISVYYKDKNTVLLYGPDGERYTWISNPGKFFEDLAGQGSIIISENIDYQGRKAHLVRWLKLNQDCYIDTQTKLPIAMGSYQITYEEPLTGTFDIVIPNGAVMVDKRPGAKPAEEPEWMKNDATAQSYFNQARKALDEQRYSEAIDLFSHTVEIQPGRNWAWFWRGKSCYEMGDYVNAIYNFSKVIDMFSKFGNVPHYCYLARGLAYRASGNENAAQDDFNIALPIMIDALRHPEAAGLFDFADDPLNCGDGLQEGCNENPTREQSLTMMVDRLHSVTGQNLGYDPNESIEEKEQAISVWEQWFKKSGENKYPTRKQ